jgi:metal-sulfur cluster biosynthetic enzyme
MCPGSGETHTAFGAVLQSCHCGVAHAIKDQVKAAINANPKLTAQEIQADLAAKWGEKIKTGA